MNGVLPRPPLRSLSLLLDLYELEPYDVTRRCERTLWSIAFGEYAPARVLARRLLARTGLDVAIAPLRALPAAPPLEAERIERLSYYIGKGRIELVEAVWPDFGRAVAERLEVRSRVPSYATVRVQLFGTYETIAREAMSGCGCRIARRWSAYYRPRPLPFRRCCFPTGL